MLSRSPPLLALTLCWVKVSYLWPMDKPNGQVDDYHMSDLVSP